MKGLVISSAIFAAYVVFTVVVSHFGGIRRYGRVFFPAVVIWTPFYFASYALTPADCWFLPATWLAKPLWLDVVYGYVVYLLNCHSYIDFFFGFTGGFSTSLLREILVSGPQGCTTEELATGVFTEDGRDKVYERRIPHLTEAGMIRVSGADRLCVATVKGRRWATLLSAVKRMLNLDKGG